MVEFPAVDITVGPGHDVLFHGPGVVRVIEDLDKEIPEAVSRPVREALIYAYLRALDDINGWTPETQKSNSYAERHSTADKQLALYTKLHFSTR